MEKIKFIFRYIKYLFQSKGKSSVHSSFVLDLYTKVILPKKSFYSFDKIDAVREMLLKNEGTVKVTDFGAGSHLNNSKEKKISAIAKNAAKSKKIGELLSVLCNHFAPNYALELGTSLGISTLYQYSASKSAQWTTMEGCPETAKLAQKVFHSFKAESIKIKVGDFKLTLPEVLEDYPQLDYVFFDGNHQKEPTIEYFEKCLPKAIESSLFIFDDIHWSGGMEEAWNYIKEHPRVTVTIDLFWIGLVFFKKGEEKEDFVLKY